MGGEATYWAKKLGRRLSRREAVRLALRIGAGMGGLSLLGCAASPKITPTPGATPAAKPVSPGATPTPKPVYGGTLRLAMGQIPGEDPARNLSGSFDYISTGHMYDSLLVLDHKLTLQPGLAVSWETPEPTRVIFKLSKGVKFHDGSDFNAAVGKFNYDRQLDPETKSGGRADLEKAVQTLEVVDDSTLTYVLKNPSVAFLVNSMADRAGAMASPAAVKKFNNDLRRNGVGTGPFQHKEWLLDLKQEMVRFNDYWRKGLPYLDGILTMVVPDETTRKIMLQTDAVDFAHDMSVVSMEELAKLPQLEVKFMPGDGIQGILMNMEKPPLDKKAVRQAIAYAIDRKAISEAVYRGKYQPAEGHLGPQYWFYGKVKGYPFDPAKAREKLAEGGYPNGFEVTVIIRKDRPTLSPLSEAIQAMLSKVGVRLKIQSLEAATYATLQKQGDYEIAAVQTPTGADPQAYVNWYLHPEAQYRGAKMSPEAWQLIVKADRTYDQEERGKLYVEVDKYLTEDVIGFLPIAYNVHRLTYNKRVKNYIPPGNETRWNFSEVWIQA
ncbi:MAG: hypothetical protein HYU86_01985 [Chloroflexi bacterium]|nr:hypothetical protein [Chloroflexota bacterium]